MAVPAAQDQTGNASGVSASSAGGGAGTGTGVGDANGTNTLNGFSARYNPSWLAQNVYQSPWTILDQVFGGLNKTGAGYSNLRDIGADPLSIYNMTQGQTGALAGSPGGSAVGDYTNWLAGLYKDLGTVGGRGFSGTELLNSLFNPSHQTNDGVTTGSALYNALTQGDASTQMRTLFNLAQSASNVGMNPLAARGYQGALQRVGDTAMSQQGRQSAGSGAANIPMYELIKQIAPGLIPG